MKVSRRLGVSLAAICVALVISFAGKFMILPLLVNAIAYAAMLYCVTVFGVHWKTALAIPAAAVAVVWTILHYFAVVTPETLYGTVGLAVVIGGALALVFTPGHPPARRA
jgi:hypothetical protein